jgi:RNA polymerase sigma-70 factor, ECF subfamily
MGMGGWIYGDIDARTNGAIQIVQRAIQGDSEAFSSLFQHYFNAIYRYLVSLSGDADTADDLAQETFIRAYKNLHRLGPPYAVRPWLYRIAHNTFINHIKGKKASISLDTDLPIASDEPSPEHQVLSSEWAGPVGSALKRLAPTYREALILRELDGFQYNDIAEIMGVSLENVKVVLHRARASFKDQYSLRVLAEDPLPDCDVLGDLLDTFVDGETTTAAQDRLLRDHLKSCDTCQQRKRQIAAAALLLQKLDYPQPTDAVRARVWRKSTKPPFSVGKALSVAVMGAFLGLFGAAAINVAQAGFTIMPPPKPTDEATEVVQEQNFTPALTPTGNAFTAPPASGITTAIFPVASCSWIGGDQFQWYEVKMTYQDGVPIESETLSGPYSGFWQPNCPAAGDSASGTSGGSTSSGDSTGGRTGGRSTSGGTSSSGIGGLGGLGGDLCTGRCGNYICEPECGEDSLSCGDCAPR